MAGVRGKDKFVRQCRRGLPKQRRGRRCGPCVLFRDYSLTRFPTESPGRGTWQLTPVFLPGESRGQRSLVGTVHGVAKSQTRLSMQASQFIFSITKDSKCRPFNEANINSCLVLYLKNSNES